MVLVPEQWNRHSAAVVGICPQVELSQEPPAVDGITFRPSLSREVPPVNSIPRIYFNQLNDILQLLQRANNDGSVGPGTDVIDVQDVSALLGREQFGGDGVAEVGSHCVLLAVDGERVATLSPSGRQ